MLLELERRLHQVTGLTLRQDLSARQRLAVVFVQHRFGSKVSTCDTPPFMNRKITRFAFGLKSSCLMTPFQFGGDDLAGLAAACSSDSLSMLDSATRPNPPPILDKAWRRVSGLNVWLHDMGFLLRVVTRS